MSKTNPILATREFKAGHNHQRVSHVLNVIGGLHYIKGNPLPYFSLTCDMVRKGFPSQWLGGGCNHELILKYFPNFADMATLHLADMNGEPGHVVENGWYRIAGALGGMGERYHAGNNAMPMPRAAVDEKTGATSVYRVPTPEECAGLFGKHVRVNYEQAKQFIGAIELADDPKAYWKALVPTMRARWKAEAEACVKKHGLVVYGDVWKGVKVEA